MNDLMTKSFTSYVDLKKEAMKDLESGPDLELGMTQIDQSLTAFVEAEEVNKEMNSIREILARLQDSHEEGKTFHQPEALTLLRARVNADIVSVLKWARAIRAKLEDMDRSSAMNRRLSRCKAGSPVDRTCCAVTNGLRKKLKELMMEFQGLRQRMMTEYKETVGRRYFTVTGEYPNEDVIEKIISSGDGNGGEELLSRAIQEHGRGNVLEMVVEIQDRHDSAKETEKSLLELHQIFLDMVLMVDEQGEQMDDIEHNVINATHYTIDATKNLKIAKQPQKSSRRGLCVGIILLLLLILLVIIPIATNFRKLRFSWNHNAGIHSYSFSAFGSL